MVIDLILLLTIKCESTTVARRNSEGDSYVWRGGSWCSCSCQLRRCTPLRRSCRSQRWWGGGASWWWCKWTSSPLRTESPLRSSSSDPPHRPRSPRTPRLLFVSQQPANRRMVQGWPTPVQYFPGNLTLVCEQMLTGTWRDNLLSPDQKFLFWMNWFLL